MNTVARSLPVGAFLALAVGGLLIGGDFAQGQTRSPQDRFPPPGVKQTSQTGKDKGKNKGKRPKDKTGPKVPPGGQGKLPNTKVVPPNNPNPPPGSFTPPRTTLRPLPPLRNVFGVPPGVTLPNGNPFPSLSGQGPALNSPFLNFTNPGLFNNPFVSLSPFGPVANPYANPYGLPFTNPGFGPSPFNNPFVGPYNNPFVNPYAFQQFPQYPPTQFPQFNPWLSMNSPPQGFPNYPGFPPQGFYPQQSFPGPYPNYPFSPTFGPNLYNQQPNSFPQQGPFFPGGFGGGSFGNGLTGNDVFGGGTRPVNYSPGYRPPGF